MTQNLFMQTKRANIVLPDDQMNNKSKSSIASERVTFRNSGSSGINGEVALKDGQNKLDTSAVYRLPEVEVKAQGRFTAERDGRINVDFKIIVPKEILSDNWRLVLNPKLLHNDSVVSLQKVILNGRGFVDKQKQDYDDYDKFLKSIVDKSQYDSIYLDRDNISRDIRKRQEYYFNIYKKDMKEQMDYEKWKTKREEEDAYMDAMKIRYKTEQYHRYARKAIDHTVRNMVENKDTTGLHAKYMKDYERKTKKHISRYLDDFSFHGDKDSLESFKKEMELMRVPKKYRELYETNRQIADINNHVFTLKDSIEISKHRYFFDEIVLNELAATRKDEMFEKMVKFPYIENKAEIRLDTIIPSGSNFVFYYTQEYPVVEGLKKIRLTMDSKIQAIDRSEYKLQGADTLSYFIASLAQLADVSLISKRTELHRNLYDRISVYTRYKTAKSAMLVYEIDYQDNRANMDKFLDSYRKYINSPEFTIDSVTLIVTTSLEGDYEDNYELTSKRALSVKNYLKGALPDSDVESLFKIKHKGEDWNTLLAQIRKTDDIVNKEDIQTMLTNAVYPDQCEEDIKKQFPADYRIMKDSIYPLLRRADFVIDLHRTGLVSDTVKIEYRSDYEEGIRLLQDREYWKAIEILANYPDYNTALCLVCLGYNSKAYDLLTNLTPTGNTEYLLAILCSRMQKEREAVSHLLKSYELDPSKIYRSKLDPEVTALIRKHNLQSHVDRILEKENQKTETIDIK
ncbi:hypothetical protein G7050_10100 [Dysgonomonas sp. HDW5A]|uniref:hypothetical protein n=1 Tax=Dysgonomonas sp. HDW5A TaxID=2714926 RepID=UPI0014081E10|nr:hypothetical protein [Dysgonomonas sp. HDW5A]QIK60161.1 hypothetical protein G7050_10100 [Dysgonomonas sp. HDW5A]